MPIRLVLAEDNYLLREGVRRLLDAQDGLEVAAVCGDLESLLAAVEAERPDVVVTDIRMPPDQSDEGIQAAARWRETNPQLGVVVLSQYANPDFALALLDAGIPAAGWESSGTPRAEAPDKVGELVCVDGLCYLADESGLGQPTIGGIERQCAHGDDRDA